MDDLERQAVWDVWYLFGPPYSALSWLACRRPSPSCSIWRRLSPCGMDFGRDRAHGRSLAFEAPDLLDEMFTGNSPAPPSSAARRRPRPSPREPLLLRQEHQSVLVADQTLDSAPSEEPGPQLLHLDQPSGSS